MLPVFCVCGVPAVLCVGGVPAVLSVRSDGVLLLERLNSLATFWKKEQLINISSEARFLMGTLPKKKVCVCVCTLIFIGPLVQSPGN